MTPSARRKARLRAILSPSATTSSLYIRARPDTSAATLDQPVDSVGQRGKGQQGEQQDREFHLVTGVRRAG